MSPPRAHGCSRRVASAWLFVCLYAHARCVSAPVLRALWMVWSSPLAAPHPQTFDEKQKAQDQALAKAENEIEFLRLQRQSLEEALTIVEQEHA